MSQTNARTLQGESCVTLPVALNAGCPKFCHFQKVRSTEGGAVGVVTGVEYIDPVTLFVEQWQSVGWTYAVSWVCGKHPDEWQAHLDAKAIFYEDEIEAVEADQP